MPPEDRERAALRGLVLGAHPEQEPAAIQLLLRMLGLVLVEPAGEHGADQAPAIAVPVTAAATTPAEATTVPAATTAGR